MFNICVCDDNDTMRKEISTLIKDFSIKNDISINITGYASGEEMLFDLSEGDKHIDIFFLDILMKKLDGIQTASQLRKINPTAQIIFLTVSKEHVFDALDVMPLHYLVKQDVKSEKIEKVLMKAIALAEKNKQEIFTYKFGKVVGSVPLNEIVYFEVKNRIIEMKLKNKTSIEFYSNMTELEEQIPTENFQRVHRSFIINFENVDYLNGKEFVCVDETIIPIGQKYIDVKEKYQSFLLDKISAI